MGQYGQRSPDGRYWWDGQQWLEAPPAETRKGFGIGALVATAVLTALVTGVCGFAIGAASSGANRGTAALVSPTPGVPSAAAKSPSPPSQAPFQPIKAEGQGSKVTDPFEIPKGNYRVTWSAQDTSRFGSSNFIVHLVGETTEYLVSVILPNPASGEAGFKSAGGKFYLDVKADTANWSITLTKIA
jgi:hypothetical protein